MISVKEIKRTSPYEMSVLFEADNTLMRYFVEREFKVRYSDEISDVPYGVAIIPFVCNVLPLIWLTNSTLVLDEIDEDFYHSIAEFKKGYEEMYPNLKFGGKIDCKKIVKCQPIAPEQKSLVFFSGGVDAFATLVAHIEEQPTLFTICGADISLSNTDGWNTVLNQVQEVSQRFTLPAIQCYSNFRECIDEDQLCAFVKQLGAKDDWWHGFQHGIGLIGHAAPIAYRYGYDSCYIASSYTIRERPYVTCASDPRIDSFVRFCGARVYHDQFECNRQQKINHIVSYCNSVKKYMTLRVCYTTDSGTNCCTCEKCTRTIFGILVAGGDPRDYGFAIDDKMMKRNAHHLMFREIMPAHIVTFWEDMQAELKASHNTDTRLRWMYWYNFKRWNDCKIRIKALKKKLRKIGK